MRIKTDDGVELHVEVTGSGPDLMFLHEYSGDYRSWDAQVRHFSRKYRCIVYSARGYLPSDVPSDPDMYTQDRVVKDAINILDELGSTKANLIGISMGGFSTLNLLLDYPDRIGAAVVSGCGYGSDDDPEEFRKEVLAMAAVIREEGAPHLADLTARSPYRLAFAAKDPKGFEEWKQILASHDAEGLAHTIVGVQGKRPTLPQLAERLKTSDVPLLFVIGDEDDPCIEANLAAKRMAPNAGLAILPKTAHTVSLEEPAAYNAIIDNFFATAANGRWPTRDPKSQPASGGWVR